jgi:hypothetical protein
VSLYTDHPGITRVDFPPLLQALVRRKKLPQSEVIEELVRKDYGRAN